MEQNIYNKGVDKIWSSISNEWYEIRKMRITGYYRDANNNYVPRIPVFQCDANHEIIDDLQEQ